jgi:hypothetical protein
VVLVHACHLPNDDLRQPVISNIFALFSLSENLDRLMFENKMADHLAFALTFF